jgi:hypothetical protein
MSRGSLISFSSLLLGLCCVLAGCRGNQYARVIKPGDKEMIGSHTAGQETFGPLVDEAVGKLMARHGHQEVVPVAAAGVEMLPPPKLRVCFVGVENHSGEEIGDFKAQIYEKIDQQISQCPTTAPINRRFVEAGLRASRIRPEDLFIPVHRRTFAGIMEQQGQPVDALLFAKLTSGTTRQNQDYQRDYLLTLELVNVNTGEQDKQTAELSKGYHHSLTSRAWSNTWPWGGERKE